jgi:hypothetical protein
VGRRSRVKDRQAKQLYNIVVVVDELLLIMAFFKKGENYD